MNVRKALLYPFLVLCLMGVSLPADAQEAVLCSQTAPDGAVVEVRIDYPLPGQRLVEFFPCSEEILVEGIASAIGIPPYLEIVCVIDASRSSLQDSGEDLDGDGHPGNDVDDSILAAEVLATRAIVDSVNPAFARISVIKFGTDAELLLPLTSDLSLAHAALDTVLPAGGIGSTDFVDAIEAVRAELALNGDPSVYRPASFFLSDGRDTENNDADILAAAQNAASDGIRVDTFGVGPYADPVMLKEIADITAGKHHYLVDPADIIIELPKVNLVGIDHVLIMNLTKFGIASDRPSTDGAFSASLPITQGFNYIWVEAVADDLNETEVRCDTDVTVLCGAIACDPRTQGYWHRQGMGLHPDFSDEEIEGILQEVTDRLVPLGIDACTALTAEESNDSCERAAKQTAALIANIVSGYLAGDCEADSTGIDPGAPSTLEELVDYLLDKILDGDCATASDIADGVNTGSTVADAPSMLLVNRSAGNLIFTVMGAIDGRYDLYLSHAKASLGKPLLRHLEPGAHVACETGGDGCTYFALR